VTLVPVTVPLARAIVAGDLSGVDAAPGWPHADTLDALRPVAESGVADGSFLIADEGRVVGDCGWFGPPDPEGTVEIGYGLSPAFRRRGLGTAAVRSLLEWVEAQEGVTRVTARIEATNVASRRLIERLGFTVCGTAGKDVVYERFASRT
jgi:RimJ/RimL family protein N-acetyltransferase